MQVAYEYILEENIIIATAPDSFSDEEVIKGAKKIEDRLKKQIQDKEKYGALEEVESIYSFVDGSEFLYKGEVMTLHISRDSDVDRIELEKNGDQFLAKLNGDIESENRKDIIREKMLEWYKIEAEKIIKDKVKEYFYIIEDHSDFGLNFSDIRISINDNKGTWGSANADVPSLNFTWHIIMFEDEIIDTVVVHELAHYAVDSERNNMHTEEFYEFCRSIIPNFDANMETIEANGHLRLF